MLIRLKNGVRLSKPLLILFVAVLLGMFAYNAFFSPPPPLTQTELETTIGDVMASATPPQPNSTLVYQIILPSLVLIQTEIDSQIENDGAIGSGVVINESGDILTSLHVVDDADRINVGFADGSVATANIVATDPENDIAVLHPSQPPGLIVPAVLGGGMQIGDEAYAVGNPMGLTGSLSAGVISGLNRSFTLEQSGQRLEGLIQFDTAVNPGNSGGPLLNRYGQVVGIVTALANPTEQNFFVGVGFAVPIGTAVSGAGGPEY